MTREVWVYSAQELTPRAFDVIKEIKDTSGYKDVKFRLYENNIGVTKVLVFGSQLPPEALGGVEYIHTYSVAQIMSKPNALTVVTAALRLYFGEYHKVPDSVLPQQFHTVDALKYVLDYDKPIVIDIETDGNLGKVDTPEEVNIISIAMYDGGNYPYVWTGKWDPHEKRTLPLDGKLLREFAEILPKFKYAIYHNGKFDIRVLSRVLGVCLVNSFDTMLAHHVLNHAAGEHGLKMLAQRYLGAPDWEAGIKKFLKSGAHYELIPPATLVKYNGWDVYWTWQLYELFRPQIEMDPNNEMAFYFEMQVAEFLLDVERNGIPFSPIEAEDLSDLQARIMDEHRDEMRNFLADAGFNPNSPQQVKAALRSYGYEVLSTKEEVVQEILDNTSEDAEVHMFLSSLMAYRKASKIKSTYADAWLAYARQDDTGQYRVHATYHVHGTSTGRLSSTQPNAQNMPRDKAIRQIVALTT